MEYKELLEAARSMALEAGEVQMSFFRKDNLRVDTKQNESDIVTEADRASEAVLLKRISELFPTHSVLSEESGASGSDTSFRWVIDPLDGTTNFRSGLPNFSVSIGVEHNGETVVGVVYAPYLREMFCAVEGEGATLNGKPIHHSHITSLERSVLATGFHVDKDSNPDNNLDNVARLLPRIRGLRRLGSAAIDICYTAAGFLEGYWEMNLHDWDVSAGLLIAQEAGCMWESFRSDRNVSILVTSPTLFPQIFPMLNTQD